MNNNVASPILFMWIIGYRKKGLLGHCNLVVFGFFKSRLRPKIRNSVTMTAVIYLKEDVPALLGAERNISVMDLGCGPSICNIISASLCSNLIYMAELLEGNRKEIIKFLCNDTDAWNWTPYFEFQVVLVNHVLIILLLMLPSGFT